MANFNRVVIKQSDNYGYRYDKNNVHIAVHPFPMPKLFMMNDKTELWRTDHRADGTTISIPEWANSLADKLWDEIPGLDTLFFNNGEITLQHNGLFSDEEIVEAASEIVRPYLERNLDLSKLSW